MYEKLKHILATKFQIDPAMIEPTSTLTELELDSLDIVELAVAMESELGTKVTDDDLVETQQLDAIVELATSRKEAAA